MSSPTLATRIHAGLFLLFCWVGAAFAQLGVLHDFAGGAADGRFPWSGRLLEHEGRLYGMTRWGGAVDAGVLFAVDTDGGNYAILHHFGTLPQDGREPLNSLSLSDGTLYGMALTGGASGCGTVFQISLDGTDYQTIHHFDCVNGNSPHGDVLPVGEWLYGLTRWGGAGNIGLIFRLNRSTHGYSLLHSFGGYPLDGNRGHFGILHHAGVLYGQTWVGGAFDAGSIWRIDVDGANYQMLHSLAPAEGLHPHGYLVWLDGWLYGLSPEGGEHGGGSAYRIRPDGSAFEVIHAFGTNPGAGSFPIAEFTVEEGRLVAPLASDGVHNTGAVCEMDPDGANYRLRYSFTGTYGGCSANGLTRGADGLYYGMTSTAGAGGHGVIYRLNPLPTELTIAIVDSGTVELSWNSCHFNVYQLQQSESGWPAGWTNLGDEQAGTGSPLHTQVAVDPDGRGIFRAVFLDP